MLHLHNSGRVVPLIQNFSRGQAKGDKCQHGRLVWWRCPFCSTFVTNSCDDHWRLNTSPSVDDRVSKLCKVLDSAEESVYLVTVCVRHKMPAGRGGFKQPWAQHRPQERCGTCSHPAKIHSRCGRTGVFCKCSREEGQGSTFWRWSRMWDS